MRITVNTPEAAAAVPKIREHLDRMNCNVPLIGDFHYNGHRLLTDNPACAEALAKYRINPGNVGFGRKKDEQFAQMVELACKYDKPVRIGVNWGSLDQNLLARIMDENSKRAEPLDATAIMRHAMVTSALESAAKAEEVGLAGEKIILSCKVSSVQDLIAIYRELSKRADYALHLGLTEAGMGSKGIVAFDRGTLRSAAGRHRRHHPHFADAGTGRFAQPGSHRRPGNPADHGLARLHADGRGLPGLRPDDQHLVPGTGRRGAGFRARQDAGMEAAP